MFVEGVGLVLSGSEGDGGDPFLVERSGVETAVTDLELGIEPYSASGLGRMTSGVAAGGDPECLERVHDFQSGCSGHPVHVADRASRSGERFFVRRDDALAEGRLVASRFSLDRHSGSDLVGGLSPFDPSDIRCASISPLLDLAEPAVAVDLFERLGGDDGGGDSSFGLSAGVGRDALDFNPPVGGADGAHDKPGGGAAVDVESHLNTSQIFFAEMPGA